MCSAPDAAQDTLVYEQPDETFYTSVTTTKDEKYILIDVQSTLSSEWLYARADDPALAFKVFRPRERDFEYYIEHLDGRWIIRTNWNAPNYRLMEAKVGEEGDRANWKEIVAHRQDAFIHSFDVFRTSSRSKSARARLRKIRIRPWGGGKDFYIASDEPAYATSLGQNAEIDTPHRALRVQLAHHAGDDLRLRHPDRRAPADEAHAGARRLRSRELPHRTRVGGGARRREGPGLARLPRRLQEGRHGADAAVRLRLLRRDLRPAFSVARVSLLDRGFVYALAHIRGGQEMGRRWYDDGRLLNKKNTFTDFIDVTRFLVKRGLRRPEARLRRWAAAPAAS